MRLAPARPVLKMRAKGHRNLARRRTQTARRLHAVLCGLVPGGIGKDIMAADVACEEQFARVGSAPLVEACHPLSMTDAPVLARADLAAFWITKTPEAACVQATVSEWPSRPDVAAVAAITERDRLRRPCGRRVRTADYERRRISSQHADSAH